MFNVYFICILSNGWMYGILVVFRPFIGEVLTGKVLSCREDGVRGMQMKCKWIFYTFVLIGINFYVLFSTYVVVSMQFFDDILIPSYLLQVHIEDVVG